jgi:hypothetical protein
MYLELVEKQIPVKNKWTGVVRGIPKMTGCQKPSLATSKLNRDRLLKVKVKRSFMQACRQKHLNLPIHSSESFSTPNCKIRARKLLADRTKPLSLREQTLESHCKFFFELAWIVLFGSK